MNRGPGCREMERSHGDSGVIPRHEVPQLAFFALQPIQTQEIPSPTSCSIVFDFSTLPELENRQRPSLVVPLHQFQEP